MEYIINGLWMDGGWITFQWLKPLAMFYLIDFFLLFKIIYNDHITNIAQGFNFGERMMRNVLWMDYEYIAFQWLKPLAMFYHWGIFY